jgi:hypothetical protein
LTRLPNLPVGPVYLLAAKAFNRPPPLPHARTISKWPRMRLQENVMSNLSFARIMYGATQDHHSPSLAPVSNRPSQLSSGSPLHSSASAIENFLHKAWNALTRHN